MRYRKTTSILIAPLFLAALFATGAASQTSDWAAVRAVPLGTKIKVTLKNHPTFGHCFVEGVSDDRLICTYGRGPLLRRRVFLKDDVEEVFLTHSGPLIGLAVGAAAGAGLGASRDPIPGLGRGGTSLVTAGILGGVGAFAGLLADPFFHGREIYRGPRDPHPGPTKTTNSPASISGRSAPPPEERGPCLRDGTTMKCVDP
jgi:hypothetical protein